MLRKEQQNLGSLVQKIGIKTSERMEDEKLGIGAKEKKENQETEKIEEIEEIEEEKERIWRIRRRRRGSGR